MERLSETPVTIAEGFKGERAIVTPYNIRNYQSTHELTCGLYLTHIGYYPMARYHYRERDQGANENILIYCEKGKGWVDWCGERYPLGENHYFIIPAGAPHAYGADRDDPWSIFWLHFQGEQAERFRPIMGCPGQLEGAGRSRDNDRMKLFESMFRNLEMGYSPENLEYISVCLHYFLASLKYPAQHRIGESLPVESVIRKSILYMKEHLEQRVTLREIADAVGYSPSHLTALFVRETSYSPIVYFNQLRIQRACTYLQFSALKIKEVAFRLGYYDPFHFSKAFIREMGITPREYRKRYHAGPGENHGGR